MNQSTEVSTGVVPMSIRMVQWVTVEGTQIYYDKINISVLSIVGRFVIIKREQNQVRFTVTITDDTGTLQAAYFVKELESDPILNICGEDMGYYQFIVNAKVFKDAPYYMIQHYSQVSLDLWMLHTMKIIQTEVQSRPEVDWQALKEQPLEQQIEGYIRHVKRVNMSALLKRFKCSVQQMRLIIENLKKRSVIQECLNEDTFKIVN